MLFVGKVGIETAALVAGAKRVKTLTGLASEHKVRRRRRHERPISWEKREPWHRTLEERENRRAGARAPEGRLLLIPGCDCGGDGVLTDRRKAEEVRRPSRSPSGRAKGKKEPGWAVDFKANCPARLHAQRSIRFLARTDFGSRRWGDDYGREGSCFCVCFWHYMVGEPTMNDMWSAAKSFHSGPIPSPAVHGRLRSRSMSISAGLL